jgi:threonine/homoserine/homoserine lactone efflux protein
MITALAVGIAIGYVLAIPPGPIGMAAMRTGLRHGMRQATKLALGAGVLDLCYCVLAMFATSAVATFLVQMEVNYPVATITIQLCIVLAVIAIGVNMVRTSGSFVQTTHQTPEPPMLQQGGKLQMFKHHGPFFVGVGFALANLANPTFIPSLAATTTFVQKLKLFVSNVPNNVAFSVGFGVGNVAWLVTLVRIVLALQHKMSARTLTRIQQISGVTLVCFGAFYGVMIIVTKWQEFGGVVQ